MFFPIVVSDGLRAASRRPSRTEAEERTRDLLRKFVKEPAARIDILCEMLELYDLPEEVHPSLFILTELCRNKFRSR